MILTLSPLWAVVTTYSRAKYEGQRWILGTDGWTEAFTLPDSLMCNVVWGVECANTSCVSCVKCVTTWLLFVLGGGWVRCRVLCQNWCCVCWRQWHTGSYAPCCCPQDARLGSVNGIFLKLTCDSVSVSTCIFYCKLNESFFRVRYFWNLVCLN